jgi:cellobiose-specific phosphotransferase system component IIB
MKEVPQMKEKIIDILINKLGYSDHVAGITADDLLFVQPQLKPALKQWVETGTTTNIEVAGFSINMLMEKRGYTFPSALISLDWLLTDPDIAKKELTDEVRR